MNEYVLFGYYDVEDCLFTPAGFYLNEEKLVKQGRLIPLYRKVEDEQP